jgi:hypothetical protein
MYQVVTPDRGGRLLIERGEGAILERHQGSESGAPA